MARIDKSVFGHVTGKLGDMVFRNVGGEKFVSVRPARYKASQSEKAKTGRNNFAVTIAFAKKINSIPVLKEIWLNAAVPGKTSFNRIFKANGKLVKSGALGISNKITPNGLFIDVQEISVQDNKLHLAFVFPPDPNITFPVSLFLFFFFDKQNIFFQEETIAAQVPGNTWSLNTDLNPDIIKVFAANPNPVVYLAVAGTPVNKKKIYWSGTYTKQL